MLETGTTLNCEIISIDSSKIEVKYYVPNKYKYTWVLRRFSINEIEKIYVDGNSYIVDSVSIKALKEIIISQKDTIAPKKCNSNYFPNTISYNNYLIYHQL